LIKKKNKKLLDYFTELIKWDTKYFSCVSDPEGIQDQEDILVHVQDVVPIQDQGDDPLQDPEEEANVVVQEVLQRAVAAVIVEVGAEVTTGKEIVPIEA
jgi:hypothetical protein